MALPPPPPAALISLRQGDTVAAFTVAQVLKLVSKKPIPQALFIYAGLQKLTDVSVRVSQSLSHSTPWCLTVHWQRHKKNKKKKKTGNCQLAYY